MFFEYERRTPGSIAAWHNSSPWLRMRMSQITDAMEDMEMPMIPIHLIGNKHFGGDFPQARILTAEIDTETT